MNVPFKIQTGVRIPGLDGLRGLAVLLVVCNHYACFKSGPISLLAGHLTSISWTGVDLFFVLSGFLIGGILMDHRETENYFRTFYLRRICRIFPLYFLWFALFFVGSWLLTAYHSQEWYGWLFSQDFFKVPRWSFVLFLQNIFYAKENLAGPFWITVTWSLAVEEQFYLLLPAIIWAVPIRKLPYVLVALIALAPAIRLYLYTCHPGSYPYILLPCRMDTLLTGVLCAWGVRRKGFWNWVEKRSVQLRQAFIVLLAGAGYLCVFASGWNTFEMISLGYTWMAMLYACLLLITVTAKDGIIARVMRLPALCGLGLISYGVYLMHASINILMHGLVLGKYVYIINWKDGVVTCAAFAITLLVAGLSWRFFERPIIRRGHEFLYRDKRSSIVNEPATV